jgi:hypothetical protein
MSTLSITTKWPEAHAADTDFTPLPLPFYEFAGQPRDGKLESKTGVQKINRRNRFTKTYPMLSLTWIFTQVQYYAFVDFYTDGLGLGTARFRINLKWPFNNFLTEWVVRFLGEGFNVRQLDGAWQVTADVELVDPFIIADGASLEDYQIYQTADEENYQTVDEENYEAIE